MPLRMMMAIKKHYDVDDDDADVEEEEEDDRSQDLRPQVVQIYIIKMDLNILQERTTLDGNLQQKTAAQNLGVHFVPACADDIQL